MGDPNGADRAVGAALITLGLLTWVTLPLTWVDVRALDSGGARSAWGVWPLALGVALVGAALVAAGVARLVRGDDSFRLLGVAAGSVLTVAAGLVVLATEVAQSILPSWAAPVVTNSDFFALRAGLGTWLAVCVGVFALLVSLLPSPFLAAAGRGNIGAVDLAARAVVLCGAVVLAVLRSVPVAEAGVSDVLGLTESDGVSSVRLVMGDLPVLGPLSLFASLLVVASAALVVIRGSDVWVVLAGAAAGTLLLAQWLVAVAVRTADAVLPDGWLDLDDGQVAATLTSTGGVWWSAFVAMVTLAGNAVVATRSDGAAWWSDEPDASDESAGDMPPTWKSSW